MANRCFLCRRPMVKKDGIAYELCSNTKCPRSKPLDPPKENNQEKEAK